MTSWFYSPLFCYVTISTRLIHATQPHLSTCWLPTEANPIPIAVRQRRSVAVPGARSGPSHCLALAAVTPPPHKKKCFITHEPQGKLADKYSRLKSSKNKFYKALYSL